MNGPWPLILLIDDKPRNLDVAVAMLSDAYRVHTAGSGPEALAWLDAGHRPDLVLLDVMMPGMDGYAVAEALRERAALKGVPLLFLTAVTDPESEARALSAGAVDFIHKPIQMPVLLTRVAMQLELARYRGQLESLVAERTEALARSMAQLERANRSRNDFLANMSHELRTPLNAILGLAHLLRARQPEGEARGYLEQIDRAAQGLLGSFNDILSWARRDQWPAQTQSVVFSINGLLGELVAQHGAAAQAKGLTLALGPLSAAALRPLAGDAARIREILSRLIDNAIKFTTVGGVVLGATLDDGDTRQPVAQFDVTDTGVGMDAVAQARIFQAFEQAQSDYNREFGGLGLGLAIARELAGRVAGELGVNSEPGRGSRFWLRLPLAPADEARADLPVRGDAAGGEGRAAAFAVPLAPAGTRAPALAADAARVLVVDDNEINRLVLARMLAREGCAVTVAVHGAEALALAEGGGYAMVMMDLQMPVMDGFQAALAMRQDPGLDQVPIVAVSANHDEVERRRSELAGMQDFIAKPVDPGRLAAVLDRFLPGRRR